MKNDVDNIKKNVEARMISIESEERKRMNKKLNWTWLLPVVVAIGGGNATNHGTWLPLAGEELVVGLRRLNQVYTRFNIFLFY